MSINLVKAAPLLRILTNLSWCWDAQSENGLTWELLEGPLCLSISTWGHCSKNVCWLLNITNVPNAFQWAEAFLFYKIFRKLAPPYPGQGTILQSSSAHQTLGTYTTFRPHAGSKKPRIIIHIPRSLEGTLRVRQVSLPKLTTSIARPPIYSWGCPMWKIHC